MLRVTTAGDDPTSYRLRVEGRLVGASSIEILRQELAGAAATVRPVVVEISGLMFADEEGITLLAAAAERGVKLVGCSPWLASLLEGASSP